MDKEVGSIVELGFKEVGEWKKDGEWKSGEDGKIIFVPLDKRVEKQKDWIYAFVVGNVVEYVGVTNRTLERRMQHYRTPGKPRKARDVRGNEQIKDVLKQEGGKVFVYAASSDDIKNKIEETARYINFAAAVEDKLIKIVNPEWNRRGKGETK
jgi:hypothetical protein